MCIGEVNQSFYLFCFRVPLRRIGELKRQIWPLSIETSPVSEPYENPISHSLLNSIFYSRQVGEIRGEIIVKTKPLT